MEKIPAGTGLVQANDVVVGSQIEYDLMHQNEIDNLEDEIIKEEISSTK